MERRPVRLGGVLIRDLTSVDYDQWQPTAITDGQAGDVATGYRRERELHQGRAAAIVERQRRAAAGLRVPLSELKLSASFGCSRSCYRLLVWGRTVRCSANSTTRAQSTT